MNNKEQGQGMETHSIASASSLQKVNVPANSSSPGVVGQYAVDADYFYIVVAANTWRRVLTESF